MRKLMVALVLFSNFALTQAPGASPQKSWRDSAEYKIANSAATEIDAATRLFDLDSWTQRYPASDFIDERLDMYLAVYQRLNQAGQAFDAAQKILQSRPNNLLALMTVVSEVTAIKPPLTDAQMDTAAKAAHLILDNPEVVFAAANKPPNMTEAVWAQTKDRITPIAQQALAAVQGIR